MRCHSQHAPQDRQGVLGRSPAFDGGKFGLSSYPAARPCQGFILDYVTDPGGVIIPLEMMHTGCVIHVLAELHEEKQIVNPKIESAGSNRDPYSCPATR